MLLAEFFKQLLIFWRQVHEIMVTGDEYTNFECSDCNIETSIDDLVLDFLTTQHSLIIMSIMKARLLLQERYNFDDSAFAERAVWEVPVAVPGSAHEYKYRLAFVVNDICVLRHDNEAGKGDHRHIGDGQTAYRFARKTIR